MTETRVAAAIRTRRKETVATTFTERAELIKNDSAAAANDEHMKRGKRKKKKKKKNRDFRKVLTTRAADGFVGETKLNDFSPLLKKSAVVHSCDDDDDNRSYYYYYCCFVIIALVKKTWRTRYPRPTADKKHCSPPPWARALFYLFIPNECREARRTRKRETWESEREKTDYVYDIHSPRRYCPRTEKRRDGQQRRCALVVVPTERITAIWCGETRASECQRQRYFFVCTTPRDKSNG